MLITKMVKLSEQLKRQPIARPISTRTQRKQQVIQQRLAEQERTKELARREGLFEKAKTKVKDLSIEEYEKVYNTWEDWLQKSFTSPTELRAIRTKEIESTSVKTKNEIDKARIERERKQTKYKIQLDEIKKQIDRARTSEQKARLLEDKKDLKQEFKEEDKFLKEFIRRLEDAKKELDKGKSLDFKSIIKFAEAKAEIREARAKELFEVRGAEIKSEKAFETLVEKSPFKPFIQQVERANKGQIDWANPKNVTAVFTAINQSLQQESIQKAKIFKEQQALAGIQRPPLILKQPEKEPSVSFTIPEEPATTFFGRLIQKGEEFIRVGKEKEVTKFVIPPDILGKPKPKPKEIVEVEDIPVKDYDLTQYELFVNPKTQELIYYPKVPEEGVAPLPEGFEKSMNLVLSIKTGELKEIPLGTKPAQGSIFIDPITFQRTYKGMTPEKYYKEVVVGGINEATGIKKFGRQLAHDIFPFTTPAGKLGFRPYYNVASAMVDKVSGGRFNLGVSDEEAVKDIERMKVQAFTQDYYDERGIKRPLIDLTTYQKIIGIKVPSGFLPRSPPVQASSLYLSGQLAGGILSQAGAVIPTGIKAVASQQAQLHPILVKIGAVGLTAGVGGAFAFKTAKGVRELKKAGASLSEQVGFVGQQATFLGVGVAGFRSGLKHGLPIKYGQVNVPIAKVKEGAFVGKPPVEKGLSLANRFSNKLSRQLSATTFQGEPLLPQGSTTLHATVWRGVYFDTGSAVKPIFGQAFLPSYVPTDVLGQIKFVGYSSIIGKGFPQFQNIAPSGFYVPREALAVQGFVPTTRLETAFAKQWATTSLAPADIRLLQAGLPIRTATEYFNPKFQTLDKFRQVESVKKLTSKQQEALWKYFQKQRGDYLVYGSSTVKGYGVELKRPLHDIDATFFHAKSGDKAQEIVNILKKAGGKAGTKVTLAGGDKNQILIAGTKEKLLDIHGYDSPDITNQDIWGFRYQQPVTQEGVKIMTLSQTATQKLGASLTFQVDKAGNVIFAPESPTATKFLASQKHLSDFYRISKVQATQGLTGNKKTEILDLLKVWKESSIEKFGEQVFAGEKIVLGLHTATPSLNPSDIIIASSPSVTSATLINQILSSGVSPSVISPSVSPIISRSPSISVSPSISPSISFSPSPSPSPSLSVSLSPSPSVSPSISVSPSPSPSPSISVSPSPSPSVSVSPSPSPSVSLAIAPTPPFPPFLFLFPFLPKIKKKLKKKKKKKKLKEELLYAPTLTTKIVGLEPQVVTPKQGLKLLRKVQTGFELRRAIKLKLPKVPRIKSPRIRF